MPSGFAIGRAKDSNQPVNQEQVARLMHMAVNRYLKDNFEDVGPRFANEALKIHYGAEKPRNIRGVSTQDEEKMLAQEGVEFFKVAAPALPEPPPIKVPTQKRTDSLPFEKVPHWTFSNATDGPE